MESAGRTASGLGDTASYLEGIMERVAIMQGDGVVGDGATADEAWADAEREAKKASIDLDGAEERVYDAEVMEVRFHGGIVTLVRRESPADWSVGDRVSAGEPGTDDYDTGTVLEVGTRGYLIGWDSCQQTWAEADELREIEEARR